VALRSCGRTSSVCAHDIAPTRGARACVRVCVRVRACVSVRVCEHSLRRAGVECAGILSGYGTLRFLTSLSILFFPKFKTVFNGLTIIVYLSVMVIGQHYGQQLLKKMKNMQDQAMKKQLTKLTVFIIMENVVLIILLLVFAIRTAAFAKKKETHPWSWFYLKVVEKSLELISIIVLSFTMMGGGAKKKKKPESKAASATSSPASTTVTRTRKKSPGAKAAASPDGDKSDVEAGSTGKPRDDATTALLASAPEELSSPNPLHAVKAAGGAS
jgi:hypothetical protein